MDAAFQHLQLLTQDGVPLACKLYFCSKENAKQKVLIINAATGVSQQLYHHYATYMMNNGYMVLTYDYRGIAASRPASLRGFKASFRDWGQLDFHRAVEYVKDNFSTHKIVVLGHSIGGVLVGTSKNIQAISGIITIGSQPAFYKDWNPFSKKIKFYFLWHLFFPTLNEVFGYVPGKKLKLIEDIPYGVMKDWHQRRKSPDITKQFSKAGCSLFFDSYKGKLLTIGITDDQIGTAVAIQRIHDLFSHAEKEQLVLTGSSAVGHFGFFSRRFEKEFWVKTLNWFDSV